jgi:glycosyltransferase involved in cell wall biosynthesis
VVDGIPVTRYPVKRPRNMKRFGQISLLVFDEEHGAEDERRWVEENGPLSPALVRAVSGLPEVDLFLFYSYRYYHTFFGLPRVADRAILVPTAEADPAVRIPIFRNLFRSPRGILYLTPEEQALIEGVSGNGAVPSAVIGSGVSIPESAAPIDLQQRFGLSSDYLLYVGRIDKNKGVDRLFRYYAWLKAEWPGVPPLVLVGAVVLPIPDDAKVRHLGFVSEAEKYALLAGCSLFLMPSRYESLSIVALEAWAMGRAVLADAACQVLEGQCRRSGGGLFYRDYAEFRLAVRLLLERPDLLRRFGAAGRDYVRREFDWSVVEALTTAFLEKIAARDVSR